MTPISNSKVCFSFGPFVVVPAARTLSRDGNVVELGGRTLDLLIALLGRPSETLSKRELLAQVWPDVVVDEGSLRFHIANLRKTLGDGVDGARYITTVPGRGYCLVAPVIRSGNGDQARLGFSPPQARLELPARSSRMVGRTDDLKQIRAELLEGRFVTIVGSGGVGKTTVAVAVGHDVAAEFDGGVLLVDLGAITDGRLIAATAAAMLGLSVQNEDAESTLIAQLRERRALVIFDTCEHLIENVAQLASRLFNGCPLLNLLATSREALRADGERVYVLGSLPCPPDDAALTIEAVSTFPAAQLFLERVRASGVRLDLRDTEARTVGDICRRLDGVALAIELAAGRVHTYGLHKTAALLDEHLSLSWRGKRSAPPRQRTLHATLDWSYALLSEKEREVLKRFSVFIGYFTFEAALQVVATESVSEDDVYAAAESLIEKSLVSVSSVGAMMRYRLLDTTRAYAIQTFANDAERADPCARHALYFTRALAQMGSGGLSMPQSLERGPRVGVLGNVRVALQWCFSTHGDLEIGIGLATAAVPVFLGMSLLTECHEWSQHALSALSMTRRGSLEEMWLQAGLAMSTMFIRNHDEAARVALTRSLSIAEARGDTLNQMLMLGPLHMYHFRRGEFRTSLHYAKCYNDAAKLANDPDAQAVAHCLTGIALHVMGELETACSELQSALRHGPVAYRNRILLLGFDYYIWGGMALGRTLWLLGRPAEAITRIRACIDEAEQLEHPVTLSMALHWAASVYLWTDDLDAAEIHIDWFLSRAETHSLGPYLSVASGLKGELLVRRGNPQDGVVMLENALMSLHAMRYELVSTSLELALAQGLCDLGRTGEGITVIDTAMENVKSNGDRCYMAELFRVRAKLLSSASPSETLAAQGDLEQALNWSRRQSALGWERRAQADRRKLRRN